MSRLALRLSMALLAEWFCYKLNPEWRRREYQDTAATLETGFVVLAKDQEVSGG
jgi:hypothetical protein